MDIQQNQLAQGLQFHKSGKLSKAQKVYRTVLKSEPRNADALMLLGMVYYEIKKFTDAIKVLKKAVSIRPKWAGAQLNLGLALQATGRRQEARDAFERALAYDGSLVDAEYCLGVMKVQGGEYVEGRGHLEKIAGRLGSNAGLFGWLGVAMQAQGEMTGALSAYHRALELDADNLQALIGLSSLPLVVVDRKEALSCAERALELAPNNADALASYAHWQELLHKPDEALDYAKRAIAAMARHPLASLVAARTELSLGDAAAALERGRALLEDEHLDPHHAYLMHQIMGRAHDKLGNIDSAYSHFEMKSRCMRALPEFERIDADEIPQTISRTMAWLNSGGAQTLEPLARDGYKQPTPVFLIGFPRSGTTLMEHVLGAHPRMQSSDELPAVNQTLRHAMRHAGASAYDPDLLGHMTSAELDALRDVYWRHFEGVCEAPPGERTMVDKNPYNILDLPFIRILFPRAKIVMVYRDPRDVCLSNFMQSFEPSTTSVHMLDLEGTARFYHDVMALWRQSRDSLGLAYLEYKYEDLVADFEGTVVKVLDFLNLPWDEAVRDYRQKATQSVISTPSYEAVTGKISRSAVGRWRSYAPYFTQANDILKSDIKELGYDLDADC